MVEMVVDGASMAPMVETVKMASMVDTALMAEMVVTVQNLRADVAAMRVLDWQFRTWTFEAGKQERASLDLLMNAATLDRATTARIERHEYVATRVAIGAHVQPMGGRLSMAGSVSGVMMIHRTWL